MASNARIWGPAALRIVRVAAERTAQAVRSQLASIAKPQVQFIPIRSGLSGRQPIHPTAFLKQQKGGARWFSRVTGQNLNTTIRRFFTSDASNSIGRRHFDRSKLPSSNTSRRVAQFSGRAPFAHALRPNLTAGAMPRSAGGYSLGGGARYFSHTPAAPAQVVQNVSQAMRAFFLSGQRLQYDGVGPNGKGRYRSVSSLEDKAIRKLASAHRSCPGAYIDFQLNPTITALSPLAIALASATESGFQTKATAAAPSLNTEGFLDVLSSDFGRALKDLTTIYADLRRLSSLGDLPITLENKHTLRVRFPGVDDTTLEQLCDDVGVSRGTVGLDPGFEDAVGVPMALRFPYAPDALKSLTSPGGSERSIQSHEYDDNESLFSDDSFVRAAFEDQLAENPWISDPEGYESMSPPLSSGEHCSDEFEGLEGIYRFIEECDRAQGRLN